MLRKMVKLHELEDVRQGVLNAPIGLNRASLKVPKTV